MAQPTPVCVPCGLAMRCAANDQPVKDTATEFAPATVWLGDLFKCPGCGAAIVTGFGRGRIAPDCPSDARAAIEFKR